MYSKSIVPPRKFKSCTIYELLCGLSKTVRWHRLIAELSALRLHKIRCAWFPILNKMGKHAHVLEQWIRFPRLINQTMQLVKEDRLMEPGRTTKIYIHMCRLWTRRSMRCYCRISPCISIQLFSFLSVMRSQSVISLIPASSCVNLRVKVDVLHPPRNISGGDIRGRYLAVAKEHA